jgi:hypothetical protein
MDVSPLLRWFAQWRISSRKAQPQTERTGLEQGADMTTDLYTLGAMALVLVFGWLLDHGAKRR